MFFSVTTCNSQALPFLPVLFVFQHVTGHGNVLCTCTCTCTYNRTSYPLLFTCTWGKGKNETWLIRTIRVVGTPRRYMAHGIVRISEGDLCQPLHVTTE